jgi:hypothetical protein
VADSDIFFWAVGNASGQPQYILEKTVHAREHRNLPGPRNLIRNQIFSYCQCASLRVYVQRCIFSSSGFLLFWLSHKSGIQGHSLRLGTSSPSNAGKESVITVTVLVFILGARLSLRIHWQIGCIEIEVTSLTEGDHYIIICHCDPQAGHSKAKFY